MANPTDRSVQSRFLGAIAKWLGTKEINLLSSCDPLPFVSSYSFTTEDSFRERCKVPFTINTSEIGVKVSLAVFVPLKNIIAPAGTLVVKLMIVVAGCRLITGSFEGAVSQTIEIPYNDALTPYK